jgi:hypothetical protein
VVEIVQVSDDVAGGHLAAAIEDRLVAQTGRWR